MSAFLLAKSNVNNNNNIDHLRYVQQGKNELLPFTSSRENRPFEVAPAPNILAEICFNLQYEKPTDT